MRGELLSKQLVTRDTFSERSYLPLSNCVTDTMPCIGMTFRFFVERPLVYCIYILLYDLKILPTTYSTPCLSVIGMRGYAGAFTNHFGHSLRHIPARDLQNAGSIIYLSHSAQAPIQSQNDV